MSNDKKYTFTFLGRFTAYNFGYSSSDAIHRQLLEYYIAYLKRALENSIPLSKLDIQNPIESRLVSLEDDCLSVRSWRYRRYDAKGTLINEREVYKVERIVLCDCLCFEVVQAASRRDTGVCYAYLRRASDSRHTIPESNLRELDLHISAWLLRYRRFPRPPLVVMAIHRSFGEQNSIDLLVFLAPNQTIGLDFVRSVTEMTCNATPPKPAPKRRRRHRTPDPRYETPRDELQKRPQSSEREPRMPPLTRFADSVNNRPLSTGCLVEPLEAMNLQEYPQSPPNLFGQLAPNSSCTCSCCQSMGLLPNILTTSELEKVRSRMVQYQLGQEALSHAYNRRLGVQNYKRPSRRATAGTQSKLRARSSTGLSEHGSRMYEHNV